MAINIYDALEALSARVAKLEALHAPKTLVAPVSYFRADKLTADGKNAWDQVIAAQPALAMINPGSGPGLSPSSSYTLLVAKAQAAGVPIYGYTHTKYGARPVADVMADVRNHKLWYGVRGIFVDTTSNKPEHVAYYQGLCDSIHALGLKVILNPGTQCLEQHAQMADYVMCSEGDLATFRARVPRPWEANYAAKLWYCVHSVPAADMPSVVAKAKDLKAGLLYVTPDLMPNPYDTLSAYWTGLCAEVGRAS